MHACIYYGLYRVYGLVFRYFEVVPFCLPAGVVRLVGEPALAEPGLDVAQVAPRLVVLYVKI